jgi:predicted negative regulator of RcsB-dependent stress response
VGTTKLTRKEILAEDPVHEALIRLVEVVRSRAMIIGLVAVGLVLVGLGLYFGLEYLEGRDMQAQQQLSRGIEFFHARLDPAALDDPYCIGPDPIFRSDAAKYEAANREFSGVISRSGSSKLGVLARYYQGLTQLRLGQKDEAVRSLETVRNNTKDRTMGYLARKVLAKHYLETGNPKGAQELVEGMIRDPQCELPREDLRVDLSRALAAQGKRDEALKVLREARDEGGRSMLQSMVTQELSRLEATPANSQPGSARP